MSTSEESNVIDLAEYRRKKAAEKANVVALPVLRSTPAAKEARQTRINAAMQKWGHLNGTETQKARKDKERC